MIKVLFLRKSNLQVGGVEMQMLRIALWLRDHAVADSVLATDDVESPLGRLFTENGFKVERCILKGRFFLFKAIPLLLKIISIHEVQVLQAHLFRESLVCRVARLFKPRLKHLFRVETYIDCSPIAAYKKSLYHLLACVTGFLVTNYIANGRIVYLELINRSFAKKRKVKVVYNGVESFGEPDFSPVLPDAEGYLHVVMVANFIKGKGHELIIHAIAGLKKKGILVKAYLFGADMEPANDKGKFYSQEIKDLVATVVVQNQVVFCGFSNNLRDDIRPFRIMVLPSFSEGTPNTILEAMSLRKLVIASDAGELPVMIEHGVSGFIHPKGDVQALSSLLESISRMDQDSLTGIRENGFLRWKTLFSLDHMMKEVSKYYQS